VQLKRQSLSAIEAGWRTQWPDVSSAVYGSRLSVICEGDVLAEAVLQQVPDETLSVLFTKTVADSRRQGIDMILAAACQTVQDLRLRYAYLFLPSDRDPWVDRCLLDAGFRAIECIEEFRCDGTNLPAISGANVTFWHGVIDSVEATRPFLQQVLNDLIANVITESSDLPQLPSPSAAQVQLLWQVLNADVQLTVAIRDHRPVGLAVLSRSKPSGHSTDEAVIVEYFGIHSDFRRRGIGRDLLRAAFESVRSKHSGCLTSFVAAQNSAAQGFFRGQGFALHATQQLWATLEE